MASALDYLHQVGTEGYQSSLFKPVPCFTCGILTWVTDSPWSIRETTRTISTLWQSYQWTATVRSYLHGEWTGSTPWISLLALHWPIGLPQRTCHAGCFACALCWSRRPGKDPTHPCKCGSHVWHTQISTSLPSPRLFSLHISIQFWCHSGLVPPSKFSYFSSKILHWFTSFKRTSLYLGQYPKTVDIHVHVAFITLN